MRIQKEKFEVALARGCLSTRDILKSGLSSATLRRAIRGEELAPKTVGRIAHALGVDVAEIMEEAKRV